MAKKRRGAETISVVRRVLCSSDLVALITQFQHGIDHVMRPFLSLYRQRWHLTSMLDYPSRYRHIHAVYEAWQAEHTLDDVPRLLECLPFVRNSLAILAMRCERRDLATLIDLSLCRADVIEFGVLVSGHLGNVAMVELFFPFLQTAWDPEGEDYIARGGHIPVVRFLSAQANVIFTTRSMDAAVQANHFPLVKWLHRNRTEGCTPKAMNAAAANGHVELVKWLHKNRREGCTTAAMDAASAKGHLEIVHFLHFHRHEGCTTSAMDSAARNGHFEVVKFLHNYRWEGCTTKAMDEAAARGNLKLVAWLHANRPEGCTTRAMDSAARFGHLHVVEWLHANRSEGCTSKAMQDASRYGHKQVVAWLHLNREKIYVTRDAAVRRNLATRRSKYIDLTEEEG
ncbi:hypothetical protein LEN26_002759 [Aphanomyces euteiches]|nr:hypothetical protein LEN26_002759 [Aphanomyces euteiches]